MKSFYVESVGLATPGMPDWDIGTQVLSGCLAYSPEPMAKYKPALLPPNERRRATEMIRLAFNVSEQATRNAGDKRKILASVFSSSGGDYVVLDQISRSLALPEKMVSPTQFHNSVHNSAAGYWGIALGSHAPSTSIAAFDANFYAGLVESGVQIDQEGEPLLLVSYDAVPPEPLKSKRPIETPFASAFLLTPEKGENALAHMRLELVSGETEESVMKNQEFETLRAANPAARALPLLELLAQKKDGEVVIKGLEYQKLKVSVEVCKR